MWMKLFHHNFHISYLSISKVPGLAVGKVSIEAYLLILLFDVCHSYLKAFVYMGLQAVTPEAAEIVRPDAIDPCSIAEFNPSKGETNGETGT